MNRHTVYDLFSDQSRRNRRPSFHEAELRQRLDRCREENTCLQEAARLWIRLYERQVVRANALEERLRGAIDGGAVAGKASRGKPTSKMAESLPARLR